MRRALLALAPLALLGACAGTPQPAAVVYVSGQSLTEAMTLATTYAQLPTCGGTALICSDPSKVAAIKAAANTADSAFHAAEAIVTLIGATPAQKLAAQNASAAATKALVALTSSVKVN